MPTSKFASPPRRQRPPGACKKTPPAKIIIPPIPPPWPATITWQLHFQGTIFSFPADDVRTIITPDTNFPVYEAQTVQPMTIGPDTYNATGHIRFEVDEETGTYDLIYDLIGRFAIDPIWIALHTDAGLYMQGPPFNYPEKVLPCLTQIGNLTISGA
jgi:hypothetical protein